MLHTIAKQLEMSLAQLKAHLAYKHGINEEGFHNGLSCFETLPEAVRDSLLKEVGLTEAEVELKEQQDDDQDGTDDDQDDQYQKDAPVDEKAQDDEGADQKDSTDENPINAPKPAPTTAPKRGKSK